VLAPKPELFDLASDPHEQRNLAAEQPARAAALRGTLATLLDQERRIAKAATAPPLSADLRERLGALGYVSGDPSATATPGADPKDKILEFRRANEGMRDGLVALNRGDYAAASRAFADLIGSGIESFEAHLYLGRSLAGMKRPDRAAPHFEQAARRAPLLEEAWKGWADARLAMGEPEAALAIVRDGRKHNPNNPRLAVIEGDLCLRLRRPEEAMAAFEAALPLLPGDATIRQRIGELHRDLGQIDARLASLRDAVAVDPASAPAWNALGHDARWQRPSRRSHRGPSARQSRATPPIIATSSISGSRSSARAAAGRPGRTSRKRCSSRPASGRRATSSRSFPPIAQGNEQGSPRKHENTSTSGSYRRGLVRTRSFSPRVCWSRHGASSSGRSPACG
jgi:tetratricopeptide (TPR) repeat protein